MPGSSRRSNARSLRALADESPLSEMLQIAQAAVNQLGGSTGRAGGEFGLFDQVNRVDPAGRQVVKEPHAVNPAADDEDVEVHGESGANVLWLVSVFSHSSSHL